MCVYYITTIRHLAKTPACVVVHCLTDAGRVFELAWVCGVCGVVGRSNSFMTNKDAPMSKPYQR